MKVENSILLQIRKNTELRRELLYRLGVSESTLSRYLSENAQDGELTKVTAVKIIALKLGVPEAMILTP